MQLAREHDLPWVADFRDNWVGNPSLTWMGKKEKQRARNSLRQWLGNVAGITTVSGPFADEFREYAPPGVEVEVLPNGFDRIVAESVTPKEQDTVFTLSFTGTFYASIQPDHLFDALHRLLRRGEVMPGEIRLRIAGRNAVHVPEALSDLVETLGYVEYTRARSIMETSSVLVLILGREFTGCYSCKLLEYLASGRYVLGLVPENSVAAELIRESGAGVTVSPDNPEAISRAILSLYVQWKHGKRRPHLNHEVIDRFDMEFLTRRLASIFDTVMKRRS